MIDPLAARLLGRHVGGGAEHDPGIGARPVDADGRGVGPGGLHDLCETEVDDLGVAVVGDHDVGRLQIAVDDALLVCAREPFGDLGRERERARLRQRAAAERLAQLLAANQLHRDERHTVGLADLVDDRDVRMLEHGCRTSLLQQAVAAHRVVHEIVGKDLQRDFAAELHVDGAIDDAHAAAANLVDDLVVRKGPAHHSRFQAIAGNRVHGAIGAPT